MSVRIHGASSTTPYVMATERAAEEIGGEWDDEELADPAPRCFLLDGGNGEAWDLGTDPATARQLAAALYLAADEMERS